MNTLAKFPSARRSFGRVVPVAAPVAIAAPRLVRRRRLLGAWSVDPVSHRLVRSWSELWTTESRADDAETGDDADGDVQLSRRALARQRTSA